MKAFTVWSIDCTDSCDQSDCTSYSSCVHNNWIQWQDHRVCSLAWNARTSLLIFALDFCKLSTHCSSFNPKTLWTSVSALAFEFLAAALSTFIISIQGQFSFWFTYWPGICFTGWIWSCCLIFFAHGKWGWRHCCERIWFPCLTDSRHFLRYLMKRSTMAKFFLRYTHKNWTVSGCTIVLSAADQIVQWSNQLSCAGEHVQTPFEQHETMILPFSVVFWVLISLWSLSSKKRCRFWTLRDSFFSFIASTCS